MHVDATTPLVHCRCLAAVGIAATIAVANPGRMLIGETYKQE